MLLDLDLHFLGSTSRAENIFNFNIVPLSRFRARGDAAAWSRTGVNPQAMTRPGFAAIMTLAAVVLCGLVAMVCSG